MSPRCFLPHLWNSLSAAENLSDSLLCGPDAAVPFEDCVQGSCLGGRAEELRGRSVLVSTRSQLTAATTLIELDGIARRLVLCPPDLPFGQIPFIVDSAGVDAVVTDDTASGPEISGVASVILCSPRIAPANFDRSTPCATEWILLTSGTTGFPKLVVHTLASLAGAIQKQTHANPVVWSTFYDIRRYGGLQVFLRAVLTGSSLVLSSPQESTADFLARAGAQGVTHISGTPSHWRRALMSPAARLISPRYIRLSGEIADQTILNHLASFYPQAQISHAFASTEAGVAFDVNDGMAGFPASLIEQKTDVEMRVEDGALQIRSGRVAERYLGHEARNLRGVDGFVNTGDILELRGDRYFFAGRRDGVINIGGLKVHPEEVEAVINRHPHVRMSLVRTRKNPITGGLVVADVVLKTEPPNGNGLARKMGDEIIQFCRGELPRHKVPAVVSFVADLPVASTGKLVRNGT